MNEKKYRIGWRSNLTTRTGCGTTTFTKEQAQNIVNELNEMELGCTHFIVSDDNVKGNSDNERNTKR